MLFPATRRTAFALAIVCVLAPVSRGSAAPLRLREAFVLALANNAQLKAGEEAIRQAQIERARAWSTMGPTASFQGGLNWNNEIKSRFAYFDPRKPGLLFNSPSGGCTPPAAAASDTPVVAGMACFLARPSHEDMVIRPRSSTTLTLSGSQPLLSPALVPAVYAAGDGVQVAESTVRAAREELLYQVAALYVYAVLAERAVELHLQSTINLKEHAYLASLESKAGRLPKAGLLQAEFEVVRAEAEWVRAQGDAQDARSALAAILARPVEGDLQSADDLTSGTLVPMPAENEMEPGTGAAARGDVRAAEAQVSLARNLRLLEWARWSPVVLVNGHLQHNSDPGAFGARENWGIGLVLHVPLLAGGGGVVDLRLAGSKLRQAEYLLGARKAEAIVDQQSAAARLRSARRNLDVSRKQLGLAADGFLLTRISFQSGLSRSLDVIDANQRLLGAGLNAARAALFLQLQLLDYWRSQGRLENMLKARS